MKKGISPVISVVILMGIAATAAISIYYWVGSFNTQPQKPEVPKEISVSVIECKSPGSDPSQITIRDTSNPGTGAINQTEKDLIASNASLDIYNCNPNAISPGETMSCNITAFEGTISIYGNGTDVSATQVTC